MRELEELAAQVEQLRSRQEQVRAQLEELQARREAWPPMRRHCWVAHIHDDPSVEMRGP
jgi:hypothetical protein